LLVSPAAIPNAPVRAGHRCLAAKSQRLVGAPQKSGRAVNIRRQMWPSRSWIVQAVHGTLAATGCYCPCPIEKGDVMKKKLMALAAAATLAVSAMALPHAAEARGGRIAAGGAGRGHTGGPTRGGAAGL